MASINQIIGAEVILANLKRRSMTLALDFSRGLRKGGLLLQRESQRHVPVDYGILKASAFTRASGTGFGTVVIVGYTANYAAYVHELVGMKLRGQPRPAPHKGKYWDPQGRGQAKFLEEPARRLKADIKRKVWEEMKIK